jgi:hypothetical protein
MSRNIFLSRKQLNSIIRLPETWFIVVTLIALYLSSLYSYVLFPSLAECFTIVVAWAMFAVAWNSQRFRSLLDEALLLQCS